MNDEIFSGVLYMLFGAAATIVIMIIIYIS